MVLIQILRLYEDVNVSSQALERVIEQDPALTARILRVASSSQYGNQSVTSISRAVNVVGMNTLRSISISLGYQHLMTTPTQQSGLDMTALWKHSLATGVAAREIGRVLKLSNFDELYIAGLIHDIGILTLDRFAAAELNVVIKTALMRKISLVEADLNVLGYDHDEIGGLLADKWKLSSIVTDAIRFHHRPDEALSNLQSTLVIAGANFLAYGLGYPAIPSIACDPNSEQYFERLGLDMEQIDHVSSVIAHEVDQATKSFGSRAA